ncbi:MAG: AAA family ATPase [Fuerstiella sp.]|nr:AAA family ATPase [Fuerstiella sp.]MCP4855876.1 AAA family ATPase [Fuerstiella sp.]
MNPAIYPHPCTHVDLVETHISWVLLTGLRAYKIKKPVDLGFANFTTLERRRHFCEEELRLNRRTAPGLYLDVMPITGSADNPRIGGSGPAIDYAVRMLQFDQHSLLSNLSLNELRPVQVDALADQCAEFHRRAPAAIPRSMFGLPEQVMTPVRANFDTLRNGSETVRTLSNALEQQAELQFSRLCQIFNDRKQNGMIRECHGDLHLGNMFLQNDQVTIFDGIEFNDALRWIDIVNDVAFTVMDFENRGFHNLANRFLNRWLERTGDYTGLHVLPFYCTYRAVVRAKVNAVRMKQPNLSFSEQRHVANDCRGYLELAQQYTVRHRPALMITMGPSGSGKTTATQQLLEATNTVRIRSDVERKRLYGLAPEARSTPALKAKMYSAEATTTTYDHLAVLATQVIVAGFPVVVDATFLKRRERGRFSRLADSLGVPFLIIRCEAAPVELRERVGQRTQDASEADEIVLQSQLRSMDPIDSNEQQCVIDAGDGDPAEMVQRRLSKT